MEGTVKETTMIEKTAVFDEAQQNRYELTIENKGKQEKKILVICINPASDDIRITDTTTNYLMNNLFSMGFSTITICNLYSLITLKLSPSKVGSNEENMEYVKSVISRDFDKVLIGYGNTFIGNKAVDSEKKRLQDFLRPYKSKVVELIDKDYKYEKLKTIHPLYAGQRFSGQWEFRQFQFSKKK